MAGWGPRRPAAGRVLRSEQLIEQPWMALRRERLRDADGSTAEHVVLEYPDWVDVVALTADFDIVLVDQYRHPVHEMRTELPAGAVDRNEPPLQAIQRELREETGYVSEDWHLLGSAPVNPAWQTNRIHSFLALGARHAGEQELDKGEFIRGRRLPFLEFLRQVDQGELELPLLQLAGLYLLQQFLRRTADPRLASLRARAGL
ncbi:MAG: NUDIX hydrolase [Alphaproteobacteria bacterium]|nr:NUDIX hydrolase [Alphaproteobacteria bacterium]MBV8408158.1 NUDIX hydrolase [Alphaproteobacteria bacterium]